MIEKGNGKTYPLGSMQGFLCLQRVSVEIYHTQNYYLKNRFVFLIFEFQDLDFVQSI